MTRLYSQLLHLLGVCLAPPDVQEARFKGASMVERQYKEGFVVAQS